MAVRTAAVGDFADEPLDADLPFFADEPLDAGVDRVPAPL
jgi:hypothetical protein